MLSALFIFLPFLLAPTPSVVADPNDWVNPAYVIAQSTGDHSTTAAAQAKIIRKADNVLKQPPKSIVNANGILPPSHDPHDYLSWAPYHWPDCNWCNPAGRTHLAHTSNGTDIGAYDPNDAYDDSLFVIPSHKKDSAQRLLGDRGLEVQLVTLLSTPISSVDIAASRSIETVGPILTSLPTTLPKVGPPLLTPSSSTGRSLGPAQAAAKTTKHSCTPSPTTSLAPSATWTTCSYIGRDGEVNPDVRTLVGPDAANSAAQDVVDSAIAYALRKSSAYSKQVSQILYTFFISPTTKMNPNMDFGQVVRGPGQNGVTGTFTGVLDLRGIVKINNAIAIVKGANSPDWTKAYDDAMMAWLSDYGKWLATSQIGKMASTRPNNHGTFFLNQIASTKIISGDRDGAKVALQKFCSSTFQDQVARSGEQPFEAVRTRPFHYRCFNVEALITNAKLADQVGVDLWSCKSRYGATIQTAVNFLMGLNPGKEKIDELLPHVAAVAAAYGDPDGKYAAFLKKKKPDYDSESYWFYDQPAALINPSRIRSRSRVWRREHALRLREAPVAQVPVDVPFECPAIFRNMMEVEIDDGLFVTCDELKPFYESVGAAE